MRLEREEGKPLKESAIKKRDLINYLSDAKFGSAKYQGFFDCLRQDQLDDEREGLIMAIKDGDFFEDKEHNESDLRVVEHNISHIEHDIVQKCMTLPGYYDAYYTILRTFNELDGILYDEAEEIYPEGDPRIDLYVARNWSDTWEEAEKSIKNNKPKTEPPLSLN